MAYIWDKNLIEQAMRQRRQPLALSPAPTGPATGPVNTGFRQVDEETIRQAEQLLQEIQAAAPVTREEPLAQARKLQEENPVLRALAIMDNSRITSGLRNQFVEKVFGPDVAGLMAPVAPESGFEKGLDVASGLVQDAAIGGTIFKALAPSLGGGIKKAAELAKAIPFGAKASAAGVGAISVPQMIAGAVNPELKDRNRFTKTGASFRAGVGDVLTTAGSAAEWQGWDELGHSLGMAGERIKEGYEVEPQEFTWRSFFSPDFYAVNVTRALPLTLSLLPAMYAGYKAGGAAGSKLGLSPFKTAILASITGAGFSRPLESAMEAGSAYEDAVSRGMDREKAEEVANSVFKKNLALVGLDAAQLAAAFAPSPFKPATMAGKVALGAGRLGAGALTEAGEEGIQEGFQRQAIGDDTRSVWQQIMDADPQMQEAMAIGGIFGAGMGAAGVASDHLRTIQQRTIENLPPDIQTQVRHHVETQVRGGTAPEQAVEEALDAVAETEEVREVINQVVQTYADEVNQRARIMPRAEKQQRYGPLNVKDTTEELPEAVAGPRVVYDTRGRQWEVLDDTSDPSKIKVRGVSSFGPGQETWLGRNKVLDAPPEAASAPVSPEVTPEGDSVPDTQITPPGISQEAESPPAGQTETVQEAERKAIADISLEQLKDVRKSLEDERTNLANSNRFGASALITLIEDDIKKVDSLIAAKTPKSGQVEPVPTIKPAVLPPKDERTDDEIIQSVIDKAKELGYGSEKVTVPFVMHNGRLKDARKGMEIADRVKAALGQVEGVPGAEPEVASVPPKGEPNQPNQPNQEQKTSTETKPFKTIKLSKDISELNLEQLKDVQKHLLDKRTRYLEAASNDPSAIPLKSDFEAIEDDIVKINSLIDAKKLKQEPKTSTEQSQTPTEQQKTPTEQPQTKAQEGPEEAREPWQMTRSEFNEGHFLHGTHADAATKIRASGVINKGFYILASEPNAVSIASNYARAGDLRRGIGEKDFTKTKQGSIFIIPVKDDYGHLSMIEDLRSDGRQVMGGNNYPYDTPIPYIAEVPPNVDPHEFLVKQAIGEGKQVPQDVLKDYPNIAKQEQVEPSERYATGKFADDVIRSILRDGKVTDVDGDIIKAFESFFTEQYSDKNVTNAFKTQGLKEVLDELYKYFQTNEGKADLVARTKKALKVKSTPGESQQKPPAEPREERQPASIEFLQQELYSRLINDKAVINAAKNSDKQNLEVEVRSSLKKHVGNMLTELSYEQRLEIPDGTWNSFIEYESKNKVVDRVVNVLWSKFRETTGEPSSQKSETVIESKQEKPHLQIANFVVEKLNNKESFTSEQLFKVADEAHGGTQAEAKYTPKDAYDAMELGVNKYIEERAIDTGPDVTVADAGRVLGLIQSNILEKIPTQTKRTTEQDEFQQFSTPPNLAYVAAWVANVRPKEVVLEPSAGIGGLAVFPHNAGARVIVNEFSPRRAELLKEMGFAQVFTENAEQLDNILPESVKPTIVIMNPPFSATAGRMQGVRKTKFAEQHIEQALLRLEPGGRLVAIVGRGMSDDAASFKSWWKNIKGSYNVKANISIDGSNYKKYGTSFDVQLVVIDKTGPTTESTITGEIKDLESVLPFLEVVRNDRGPTEQAASEYAGENLSKEGGAEVGSVEPVPIPTGGMGTGKRGSEGRGRDQQERDSGSPGPDKKTPVRGQPRKSTELLDEERSGRGGPESGVGESSGTGQTRDPGRSGSISDRQAESGINRERDAESGLVVESEEVQTAAGDLSDAVFTEYTPQKLKITGAHQHPGNLAQSAAMAAVEPPVPAYTPNLPKDVIENGKLSIAQLEAVVYAGQAHQQTLPNGHRRGFFIGDGTGVGKGREISGVILDNYRQGRKKAVWVSKNAPLFGDAKRDFGDIGGDPNLIFDFGKVKLGAPVQNGEGVLFTTYNTLSQGLEVASSSSDGKTSVVAKPGQKARIDQIVQWLGEDFDGVIAFDEAHHMQNSISMKGKRGMTKPSAMALAGVELQKRLPNARIVYVSATGATEVSNLAYTDRLGLWGKGTPFADKRDFVSKIQAGGLAAMELVARDMKAMGVYIARNLGFDGVTYGTSEHQLTPEQIEIYDEMAKGWQIVLQNVHKAMEETGQKNDGNSKGRALAKFWGAHQRFFNQVLTSMQMPSVIKQVKEDLKNGKAVVMQLVNTNEATLNRQLAKMQEEDSFDDIDLTPRDLLLQYLDKSFPTQQYEEYTDENGNTRSRPVYDSRGNPVVNRQAVAMKEQLMSKLGAMKVPEGPLEIVLNTFGADNVAEITGRSRRIIKVKDESGRLKAVPETRTQKHAEADAAAFMNDKKQILVFSDAGGTGRSYHASLTAKNQRHRVHYLIQAGWRSDSAVQGFGRTHRTNQKSAPHYVLVTTSLKGQKRFISSIARRLDQLGALTKGQRQTGGHGLFSAKDNLESELARDALQRFYEDLTGNQIPGLEARDLLIKMGLDKLADDSMNLKEVPEARDITRFLNRILSLESTLQNKVFDAFTDRLDYLVEKAIANGTLDVGLENFRADRVRQVDEKVVYTDEKSGAETKYVELEASFKVTPRTFKQVTGLSDLVGFYQNTKSGRIYALRKWKDSTLESGAVVKGYKMYGQSNDNVNNINELQLKRGNWKEVSKEDAQKLWDEAVRALPEFKSDKVHLITGAILPIWDRLPVGHVRVVRVKTDDGKVMLGRIVPEVNIDVTLRNLGASRNREELSPQQVVDKILQGYTIYLSNNWKISRRRVSGENRIEITGQDLYRFMNELLEEGVFTERIQWETRFFIPTGEEAASVLEKVTKYRPVIDLVPPAGKVQGSDDTYSLASPLRQKVDKVLENRITEISKGTLSFAAKHSPQKTSLNQVAAGLRTAVAKGIFKEGMLVADVGGGLWEKGTEFLAEKEVTGLVYDPYARSKEHNDSVLRRLEENGGADAAALNNVLNVIPTNEERADVLKFLYQLIKPGGQAVITVYDGNRSGKGARREFGDGTSTWQENRPLATYEEEIKAALPKEATVEKKFGMFIVTKSAKAKVKDDILYMARSSGRKQGKQTQQQTAQPPAPQPPPPPPVQINPAEPSKLSPKAAREIADILGRTLDTVIRGARLGKTGRKALGFFKVSEMAGRVKRRFLENWRVTGHELGHAFHFRAGFNPHRGEIKAIVRQFYPGGQAPKGKVTAEGLAEFIMLWFADNAAARQLAPETTKRLEGFLRNNPVLQEAFARATAIAEEDLAGTELERMRTLTVNRGIRYAPSVGNEYEIPWWKRPLFWFVDYTLPLKDLYNAAVKEGFTGFNPAKLAAISGMARDQAVDMFKNAARDKAGRFLLPGKRSLLEIAEEAAGIDNGMILFNDIYKAMRYLERYERMEARGEKDISLPMPKSYFEKVVEEAQQNYPRLVELIEEYAEILSEMNLRLLVRGGVISEEAADRVRQGSKYYFPLYTVGRGLDVESSVRRSSGPGVRHFRGHAGPTLDIVEASIMRLQDTLLAVEINRVMQHIHQALENENMGIFGVIEDRPEVVKRITMGRLKGQLDQFLNSEMDPDDEGRVVSLFMAGGISEVSKNEPILMARYGDKNVYLRVAPDLYTSILSMKPVAFDFLARVLSNLAQVSRIGALANIRYVTNAIMRDWIGSKIQSQVPERNVFVGLFKGALLASGRAKNANEIMSLYIQSGAYGSAVQEVLDSMLRSVNSEGLLSTPAPNWKRTVTNKFVRIVRSPLAALRVIEEAPRIPEFQEVIDRGLKRLNLTQEDLLTGNIPDVLAEEVERLLVEAAYASREVLVNFSLHGTNESMRKYARTVPFLQGGVQGIYREIRQVKERPGATLVSWMKYVLPLTLICWALNHKDDRFRDMPSTSRDLYWWFPITDNFQIAVAKPYFYAFPANILERFLDWGINQDDVNRRGPFEDIGWLVKRDFTPPMTSMVVDTILGLMANKDYLGRAIEPERELNLPKELRYGTGTSEAAVVIGRIFASLLGEDAPSPRQIDFFVKGIFGGIGKTALSAVGAVIPGQPPGTEKQPGIEYAPIVGSLIYGPLEGGSRIIERFYKDYNRAQRLEGGRKEWENKGIKPAQGITPYDVALADNLPAFRAIAGEMADIRKQMREIQIDPKLTPEQKRLANLRGKWLSKVAAGALYKGFQAPSASPELGITEAEAQDQLEQYRSMAQLKLVQSQINKAMPKISTK